MTSHRSRQLCNHQWRLPLSLITVLLLAGCGAPAAVVLPPPAGDFSPLQLSEPVTAVEPAAVVPEAAEAEPAVVAEEPPAQAMVPYREPDHSCNIEPGAFDRALFRVPLPATPRWNPPGQKRVGLQAGHWLVEQSPAELRGLQGGAFAGGKAEWEVNLDIARRTAAILEAEGIAVDILPTTIPVRYHAHAFVSIHADGDTSGRLSGYKLARPGFSSVPEVDDRLMDAIYGTYGAATGLARDDDHITPRMRFYYAFNSRRYCHAVAPGVPQVIVETGFMTHPNDLHMLLHNPDAPARGIAAGLLKFLREE